MPKAHWKKKKSVLALQWVRKLPSLLPSQQAHLEFLLHFRNFSFLFLFLQKRDKPPSKVLLLAAAWGDGICIAQGYTPRSWGELCQAGSATSPPCPSTCSRREVTQRGVIVSVLQKTWVIVPCEGQLHSLGTRASLCASGIIPPGALLQSLDWSWSLLRRRRRLL